MRSRLYLQSYTILLVTMLFLAGRISVFGQLVVKAESVKIIGRRTMISLRLSNATAEPIQSLKATAFITDDRGTVVGRATRWIVGAKRGRDELAAKGNEKFSFVVPLDRNYNGTTNLQCHFVYNRLVFDNGRIGNIQTDIRTVAPASQHP